MSERTSNDEVTRLLQASTSGNADAGQLLTLVYDQLRRIAQQRIRMERPDHTLQATALVHEAYLRLVGDRKVSWQGRSHFFAAAAEAMRRILIEHARAAGCRKRGGDASARRPRRLSLNVLDLAAEADFEDFLSVDEAVSRLESQDADLGRIVRLRFFAGLSNSETAEVLGVSSRTVERGWALARAWLARELSAD
jgi:RNA polymerase sigma factor (TIGR02999 family)